MRGVTMRFEKPGVHLVAFAGICALSVPPVLAQTSDAPRYPVRIVRLVIGFTPGGAADVQARIVGQCLSEPLGQQVLPDNRPGQDAIIGTAFVAKSSPDGYTLAYVTAGHAMNSIVHAK